MIVSGSVHPEKTFRHHGSHAVYAVLAGVHGQGEAAPVDDTGLAHREKLLGSKVDVRNDQLAACMFFCKPVGKAGQCPGDTVMPERVCQIGELVGLCHDDAVEAYGLRVDHQGDDGGCCLPEGRAQVRLRRPGYGFQRVEACAAAFFEKSREQISLVLEMVVERPFGDTCQMSDLRHGGSLIALLEEKLSSTLEDLLAFAGSRFAVAGRTGGRVFGLGHRFVEGLLLRMEGHDRLLGRHGPYGRSVSGPFYVDNSTGASQ